MFLMIVVLFFALSLLSLLGIVLVDSSGRPKPFLDGDGKPLAGSISEKAFVEINGRKQGLFVKGACRIPCCSTCTLASSPCAQF